MSDFAERILDSSKRIKITGESTYKAVMLEYPAFAEYLWERLEQETGQSYTPESIAQFIVAMPGSVVTVIEDDLRSGVFTPHFQRTVRTAWSDESQRFELTVDQGC